MENTLKSFNKTVAEIIGSIRNSFSEIPSIFNFREGACHTVGSYSSLVHLGWKCTESQLLDCQASPKFQFFFILIFQDSMKNFKSAYLI